MTVPENVDGQEGTCMQDAGFPGEEGGPSDEILDLWESYQDAVVSITGRLPGRRRRS